MWTPYGARAKACRVSRRCSKSSAWMPRFISRWVPITPGAPCGGCFARASRKKSRAPRCSSTTGLKTLLYGVLLPGPDIGRQAGDVMRGVHDQGFEVGLHTYDHVRWQDYVASASEAWTRIEFERGMNAFKQSVRAYPKSHAAAGWQINAQRWNSSANMACTMPAIRAAGRRSGRCSRQRRSSCPQLPTTLPTFDELLGRDGIDESTIAEAVFRPAQTQGGTAPETLQVFTLHAELEGMRLLDAFEALLKKWLGAGASMLAHGHDSRPRRCKAHARSARDHGRSAGTLRTARVQPQHGAA